MAEAVAAFSLAASIIQIVATAQRLLWRLKEYQDKTNKLPTTFQAVQIKLPIILHDLRVVESQTDRRDLPDEVFDSIQSVLDACRKAIEKLDKRFSQVSLPSKASALTKGVLAWKTVWYNNDVQEITKTLKDHVETLMWYQMQTIPLRTSQLLLQNTSNDAADLETSETLSETSVEDKQASAVATLPKSLSDNSKWDKYLTLDRCICKAGPSIHARACWTFQSAVFSSEYQNMHKPTCPYFFRQNDLRKLSFQLDYASALFRHRLQVAISMQFGQGVIAIDPKLDFRGMYRNDSPAFALLRRYQRPQSSQEEIDFDQFQLQMRQLFRNGEASPLDRNLNGDTLIHVSLANSILNGRRLTFLSL